jgi:hypothetical protein
LIARSSYRHPGIRLRSGGRPDPRADQAHVELTESWCRQAISGLVSRIRGCVWERWRVRPSWP